MIALISGFQISLLQAKSSSENNPVLKSFDIRSYAPVTPAQADFDDPVPEKAPVMVCIAPETPKEATFNNDDNSPVESPEFLKSLAPVTPKEADFSDSNPLDEVGQILILSQPNVPTEASFEEN